MACTCYTGKLFKFTRNKQEANAMLNVFMNVMCRFGHGFISLFHRRTTEWHLYLLRLELCKINESA